MTPADTPDDGLRQPDHGMRENATIRIIAAEELFGSQQEVWIEFQGERYRLRITRRGRLLLQK